MKLWKRSTAVVVTAALIPLAFVMTQGTAGAADPVRVSYTCAGITGDKASTFGDSATTLRSLGGPLAPEAVITTNAPFKVRPADGPFDASFTIQVVLPKSVTDAAKLVGVTAVDVTDATFSIQATGAATTLLEQKVPNVSINLAGSPTITNVISGKITASGAGLISYVPGPARFSIGINKTLTVGGTTIQVNAITVSCTSGGVVGSTNVQVPGAPNVNPGVIEKAGGRVAALQSVDVGPAISTDDNNPIIPGSLKIVKQPDNGQASLNGNVVSLVQPFSFATQTVGMQVCGASRIQKGVVGVSEVQTLTWGTNYSGRDGNAHPLAFTLKFGEQETPLFTTSFTTLFGVNVPTPPDPNSAGLALFTARFIPPSAADVQNALERLPGIGLGNITVTTTPTGYRFTFSGALAKSPIASRITVGKWITWLPADTIDKLQGALAGPSTTAPAVTTTTVAPVKPDVLFQQLFSGQITYEQFQQRLSGSLSAALLGSIDIPATLAYLRSIIPETPGIVTTAAGVKEVPDAPTGPLCTNFEVKFRPDLLHVYGTVAILNGFIEELRKQSRVLGSVRCRAPLVATLVVRPVRQTIVVNGRKVTRTVTDLTAVCQRRR